MQHLALLCAVMLALTGIVLCASAETALNAETEDYATFDTWNDDAENGGVVSAEEDASIQSRPNDAGTAMTEVERGTELEYLNVTEYDKNGVAWYQVYWDGWTGWVSSEDTKLWWPTYY